MGILTKISGVKLKSKPIMSFSTEASKKESGFSVEFSRLGNVGYTPGMRGAVPPSYRFKNRITGTPPLLGVTPEVRENIKYLLANWVKDKLEPKRKEVVTRVLNQRSGSLFRSKFRTDAISSTKDGGAVTLGINFQNDAGEYGGVQEWGRGRTGKRRANFYMVPLPSANLPEDMNSDEIKKILGNAGSPKDDIFWAPRGKNNFATDSKGRKMKYVFQITNKKLAAKYKRDERNTRIRYAEGMSKARKELIAKERKRLNDMNRRMTAKLELESWAKLLFIAYPRKSGITSIPGGTASSRAQNISHFSNISNSEMTTFAGIGSGRALGRSSSGKEASRWFSRSIAEALPALLAMLESDAKTMQSLTRPLTGMLDPNYKGTKGKHTSQLNVGADDWRTAKTWTKGKL